jgi:S-adenosylmethionine:tRNA ribosyltransferase-isomerase
MLLEDRTLQTIYAKEEGAVAAPSAGLHFSTFGKTEIKESNLPVTYIWLGTFNPIEVEDLSKHKMDSEELKLLKQPVIFNDAK